MKKSRSATQKGVSSKSKTKLVGKESDNVKPKSRKVVGGDVSKGEKSVAKKSEAGSEVETLKGKTVVKKIISEENENEENVKTPMKRKRGADSEIAHAFFSSLGKGSSRLRPRKEMPAFRMIELGENDCEKIVGKRVKVYWSGSRKWFLGRIKLFDTEKKLHKIYYDDGDKEELDLRQERFELEVMPGENFSLKTESKSEKKLKGSEGGKVSAKGKEESAKEVKTGLWERSSGSKKKLIQKKATKRVSSMYKRTKDAKNKKPEDLVTEMVEDVLSENVDSVKTNAVHNVVEHGDVEAGKDNDEFKSISDKDVETSKPSKALATSLESDSKTEDLGLQDGVERMKTAKDKIEKGVHAEPGKSYVRSKKKGTPRAATTRNSNSQSMKDSKADETLAENMEVDVPDNEVKANAMHVKVNIEESRDSNYQKENDQIESLAKEGNPINDGTSQDAQAILPDSISEKKELGFEDIKLSGETVDGGGLSSEGVKKNMVDLDVDVEVSLNPERVEEKEIGGDMNVEQSDDDQNRNVESSSDLAWQKKPFRRARSKVQIK